MSIAETLRYDRDIIEPLACRVAELASMRQQEVKKKLWADHNALRKTSKIPVCVTYEGIPSKQWDVIFGADHLKCIALPARDIEFELKKRIWMAGNVPDDHIVWPIVSVNAVRREITGWGVKTEWEQPEDELGAARIVAPFKDGIDISVLTIPEVEVDMDATGEAVSYARELVNNRLEVYPVYPDSNYQLFDFAVQMRGMEAVFLDVVDAPGKLHQLMDFITGAVTRVYNKREENGRINCITSRDGKYVIPKTWRVNCSYADPCRNRRKPLLSDEWAYISAQTAAGLGPAAYEEFVHPYNCRLASIYTGKTVYYHGCECLDRKLDILASLPNLRRFHVSPWSSVEKAVGRFNGAVVLEVHSHPGKVFFGFTPDEMRAEINTLVEQSQGCPIDLNLSDIHSINLKPEILGIWSSIAQEAACRS